MNNKILAFIAMAAVGAVVSVGSADTVINAFVQQFGATPHTLITSPNNVTNVQIDWKFNSDFNKILACDLTFDRIVANNTEVICKLSGHDSNPSDHIFTPGSVSPIVGFGQIAGSNSISVTVPVLCDPGSHTNGKFPQNVTGNYIDICDVQDVDDVKVIVVGKPTCDVVDPANPPANCVTTTPTAPTITINDVFKLEGNDTTTNFNFTVTRSGTTTGASTVLFATSDGSATTADNDYVANAGTVSFAAGETTKTVTVVVNGDTTVEPNETFNVNLSTCVGCTITDNLGVGTITNDDATTTTTFDISIVPGAAALTTTAYDPDSASVAQGTLVKWTNNDDGIPHTASSDDGTTFDSGIIAGGAFFVLDTSTVAPGTYPYHCNVHPGMVGTLTVT